MDCKPIIELLMLAATSQAGCGAGMPFGPWPGRSAKAAKLLHPFGLGDEIEHHRLHQWPIGQLRGAQAPDTQALAFVGHSREAYARRASLEVQLAARFLGKSIYIYVHKLVRRIGINRFALYRYHSSGVRLQRLPGRSEPER